MARNTGKPIRLDPSILDGDDCRLVCISDGFLNVLMSLTADRVFWPATWNYQLTPDMVAKLSEGVLNLQMAIDCSILQSLLESIDNRLEIVENIIGDEMAVTINNCCCCGSGSSSSGGGGINNQPSGDYPTDLPLPGEDVQPADPGYYDYKCAIARYMLDKWIDEFLPAMRTFEETNDFNYDAIAAAISEIFGLIAPLFQLAFAVFYAFAFWVINNLTSSSVVTTMQGIATRLYDQIVCAMYLSVNPYDAISRVGSVFMEDSIAPWLYRVGLYFLQQAMPYEALFYDDVTRQAIPVGYEGSVCSCSGIGGGGCTQSLGGKYPDLAIYGLTDWCYQQIEGVSGVVVVNPQGQSYQSDGLNLRIYGTNHPGNVAFGFLADIGERPAGAKGFVLTAMRMSGNCDAGFSSGSGDDMLYSGNFVINSSQKMLVYINPSIDPTTAPIESTDLYLAFDHYGTYLIESPSGGHVGYFKAEASASLTGQDYDFTYINMAWLVKN